MSASNYVNTFDGLDEPVRPKPAGRKRLLYQENHKKEQKKKVCHSVVRIIPTVGCEHKAAANGFCQAKKLSPDDLIMNITKFYE